MGAIQEHNAERDALQIPDRQAYEHYHEPLGDFGVYNGQFEQGLAGRYVNDLTQGVEGWELDPDTGGTVDRVNGGLAGNWRIRGGRAGTGSGGDLYSWKYFPVDEDRDYYISAAFITNNALATVSLGVACYTAAKVFIADAAWGLLSISQRDRARTRPSSLFRKELMSLFVVCHFWFRRFFSAAL